jgi:uncharacterized protein involved in exopolysaccharide biosynthesis
LAKQYEIAKIDEAKEATLIQVLDKAIEPERKSRPKRLLIVLLTGLVTGIVATIIAFAREATEKVRADPARAVRLGLIRRYLTSKWNLS